MSYVAREWSEDPVEARYDRLFSHDACAAPIYAPAMNLSIWKPR